MSILFIEPLQQGWERARRILFRPFRLDFWMVLGFAAFLANLTQGGGGGGNLGTRLGRGYSDATGQTLYDILHAAWFLWVFGIALAFLIVVSIVASWVSARGQFIFLEDVLYERAAIVDPWKRYARLGNSLFVFYLLLGLAWLGMFLVLFGPVLFSFLGGIWREGTIPEFQWLGLAIRGLIAAPLFIAMGVCNILTRHFVVPVMAKHGLGVADAWGRFWPLLAQHPGSFIVYLLLLLVLHIGLALVVVVFGFCTCCIGFLFLVLPYVSSVALLPALVTFRGFGPEFLAQFGPEWDVRPRPEPPPAPPNPSLDPSLDPSPDPSPAPLG